MSSKKNFISDFASKLWILLKKNIFWNESAPTDVLKNIMPLNSILSKFSELDLHQFSKIAVTFELIREGCQTKSRCKLFPKVWGVLKASDLGSSRSSHAWRKSRFLHTICCWRTQKFTINCLFVSFCQCLSVWVCMSVSVYLCRYVCVCLSVSVCLCLSACVCLSVSFCLCLSVCVSVFVWPSLSVCICLSVCIFCLSLSICLCLSVCLSVRVFLSVSNQEGDTN